MVERSKADVSLHDKGIAVLGLMSRKLAVASEISVQRALNPQGKGWAQTGNVAVEIAHATDPSPLMATTLPFITMLLLSGESLELPQDIEKVVVFEKASFVTRVTEPDRYRQVRGGDGGKATLVLIPVKELGSPTEAGGVGGVLWYEKPAKQTTI